jgi:hypothetical protein
MTEPRALITWFIRCNPDRCLLLGPFARTPNPDGAVVTIGTNGEYLPSHVSQGADLITTYCVAGAHLPQATTPQHCHLPMNGLTPQFG